MTNALSVDVEDWFHDESRPGGPATAEELQGAIPRVERNLERLFEIFARHHARATLFFLADLAQRWPGLVRQGIERGHEIACHGLRHLPVHLRTRDEFRQDAREAKAIVEEVSGRSVLGFRTPCFITRREDLWAVDVLAEEGFRYDSSYLPLRFGPPSARKNASLRLSEDGGPIRLDSGIWELPLPLSRVPSGHLLPCAAGGFALRALPFAITRHYLAQFNLGVGPAIVYTHPWEIDPESGKLPGTPLYVRTFNALGRSRMERQLGRLLSEFRFAPIAEVFAPQLAMS